MARRSTHRTVARVVSVALVATLVFAAAPVGAGAAGSTSRAKTTSAGLARASRRFPLPYSWAQRNSYIAHGMGSIGGLTLTNSREAFQRQYDRGYRLFECDLLFTADGELVARHDWTLSRYQLWWQTPPPRGLVPSLLEFTSMKIRDQYTHLTVDDVIALMRENPDMWLVTDTKTGDVAQFNRMLGRLSSAIGDDVHVRDRVIVQIYDEKNLAPVRAAGFRNVIYTFYHLHTTLDAAIHFAARNRIKVVTMSRLQATRARVWHARSHGLTVATHTINDVAEARLYRDRGVRLIYSDTLQP